MENKLFVGNLAWAATEEDLTQIFSQYGTVESVEVLRDKFTNRARGFAFLTMATDAEALNAVNNLEGKDFMGRPLKVNVARPREEGAPRRSFGGPREGGQGGGGFSGGGQGGFGGGQGGGGGGGYRFKPKPRRDFGSND